MCNDPTSMYVSSSKPQNLRKSFFVLGTKETYGKFNDQKPSRHTPRARISLVGPNRPQVSTKGLWLCVDDLTSLYTGRRGAEAVRNLTKVRHWPKQGLSRFGTPRRNVCGVMALGFPGGRRSLKSPKRCTHGLQGRCELSDRSRPIFLFLEHVSLLGEARPWCEAGSVANRKRLVRIGTLT